ncbi:MAG: hypothetical protein EOS65_02680 [Mesorhizobium sp.]|nr:MAG: hypothetical protein EOS65_02680 [Mesorhizobium sp.]
MAAIKDPIAAAATAAITEAGDIVKKEGRADIASAGFSKKWQNALRVNIYPKRQMSMDAAALVYHKIQYAGVFDEGAVIGGSPFLWLPLRDAPMGRGGRRIKPSEYRNKVGHPLYSIKRPGKAPLLGAYIRTTDTRAKGISLSQLKRGRNPNGRGREVLVPLYIGVPRVNIKQKFHIRDIVDRASGRLGELYLKNLKVD